MAHLMIYLEICLQVLDEIAKDLYHSGKCFIQSSSAASSGNVSASAFGIMPFSFNVFIVWQFE